MAARPRQIAWTPDLHPSQLIKTSDEVVAEVDRLMNDHTDGEIAAILNERGYRTGHGHAFDPISVKVVRDNYALKSRHDRLRERGLLTGAGNRRPIRGVPTRRSTPKVGTFPLVPSFNVLH